MASETGLSKFPLIAPDADPTAQEVFDATSSWLLSQAEPCMTEPVDSEEDGESTGFCCYRSADGLNACAVGVFMTDEFARLVDDVGEQAVGDVVATFGDRVPVWFDKHLALLSALQSVHDCPAPRLTALAGVAKTYGLQFAAATEGK